MVEVQKTHHDERARIVERTLRMLLRAMEAGHADQTYASALLVRMKDEMAVAGVEPAGS